MGVKKGAQTTLDPTVGAEGRWLEDSLGLSQPKDFSGPAQP